MNWIILAIALGLISALAAEFAAFRDLQNDLKRNEARRKRLG